jgi:hypothetical protein
LLGKGLLGARVRVEERVFRRSARFGFALEFGTVSACGRFASIWIVAIDGAIRIETGRGAGLARELRPDAEILARVS